MFIGVDTHKDTLAVSCVNHAGQQVAHQSFANSSAGHAVLLSWARCHAPELERVGIEGSANFGAGAAQFLYLHGIDVREVPAKLTGRERTRLRRPGKTDPTDALAIARITARDQDLPPARRHGSHEELKVLVDAREELVTARTAEANRLHADLSILRPGYAGQLRSLVHPDSVTKAARLVKALDGARAGVARRRITRLRRLDHEIAEMTAEIKQALTAVGTALTDIHGVGSITAARIIGEVGDIRRFPSKDHFAAGNGTAPIPVASGRTDRHRLNRGGNRRLNRAIHVIARTQAAWYPEAKTYMDKKRAEGKTRAEALRCLKRRLSDTVYRTLCEDHRSTAPHAADQPIPATTTTPPSR
jgi:transposase